MDPLHMFRFDAAKDGENLSMSDNSHETELSVVEKRNRIIQRLIYQPQRHTYAELLGSPVQGIGTKYVKPYRYSDELIADYQERLYREGEAIPASARRSHQRRQEAP